MNDTNRTWCGSEANCPAEIKSGLEAIETALGDYLTTDDYPCGGAAYYDGGATPWRVLYSDGAKCESFSTVEEAILAAENYADEMAKEAEYTGNE